MYVQPQILNSNLKQVWCEFHYIWAKYHAEGARSDFHSGNGNLVCSVLLWWTIDHVSVLCGIWKSNLSHIELDKMNRVPIACLHYQIMINFYEGSLAFIIISIHGLSGQDSTIFHPMKVYTVALFARRLQLATTTVYIQYIYHLYRIHTHKDMIMYCSYYQNANTESFWLC